MTLRHLQTFSTKPPREGMSNTLNLPSGICLLSLDRGDLWGLRESSCHWRDIFGPNPRNTSPPSLGLDFTRAAEKRAVVTYTISVGQDCGDGDNVREATLVLDQDLVKLGLGAVVWDCGEVLAAFLGHHCHLVSGKRVLDLGTGTGIAGLAAAQCGAKEVILTDRPTLEPLVRSNVEHNSGGFSDARVRFEPLEWGAELGSQEAPSSSAEPFDIVLSSDCLYDPATFPAFRRTLRSVCHPRTVCLMAYKRRLDSREKTLFEQLEVDFNLEVIQTHRHEPRLTPSGVTPPRTTDRCHETLREVHLILGVRHGCH